MRRIILRLNHFILQKSPLEETMCCKSLSRHAVENGTAVFVALWWKFATVVETAVTLHLKEKVSSTLGRKIGKSTRLMCIKAPKSYATALKRYVGYFWIFIIPKCIFFSQGNLAQWPNYSQTHSYWPWWQWRLYRIYHIFWLNNSCYRLGCGVDRNHNEQRKNLLLPDQWLAE